MRYALFAVALLVLSACAADRYRWNLAHAQVTGHPPLPRADVEAIIRIVTHATVNPILSIYGAESHNGREQVSVTAGASTGYAEDFELEKVAGAWRITSRGQSLER